MNAIPDSQSISPSPEPPQKQTLPNGCVIGMAEEIAQAIADCRYGPMKNLLAMRLWKSFKFAGLQKGKDAGLRSFFDLHALCADLGTSPRSLANMRRALEADGLFTYFPNPENYATGWIVWNTDYAHWKPILEPRPKRGGKRAGAGNPNWIQQASGHHLIGASQRTPFDSITKDETLSESVRPLTTPSTKSFRKCPPASSEDAPQQAAIDEPKKGRGGVRKKETYSLAYARQATLLPPSEAPQESLVTTKTKKASRKPGSYKKKTSVTAEEQEAMWQAWEAQAGVIKRQDMSKRETRRYYGVMTRLVESHVSPEELCTLAAALVRSSDWKKNYLARPYEIEDQLSTLRPLARGEAPQGAREHEQRARPGQPPVATTTTYDDPVTLAHLANQARFFGRKDEPGLAGAYH